MNHESKLTKSGKNAIIAPYRWLAIQAVCFFISAGRFNIPRAWLYFGISIIIATVGNIIMWKKTPELLNQRGEYKLDTKSWDKILVPVFLLTSIIGIPVVTGLDTGRYQWSISGTTSLIAGLMLYICGSVIQQWAMLENRHFEGTVRIQNDRGHRVISTGPYGIIRHPGYLAMILTSLVMPLMIGSMYALIPAGFVIIVLIIRTALEDQTLQKELTGYLEYTQKIKYRIFPGIW
jgi:protein-S-isoprenylcysteine O-methyltransferase Ste14